MEEAKIGFFRRAFLAITDFRLYPYITKEKMLRAIGYFLKLIFICCAILSMYFVILTSEFITNDLPFYAKKIPDFEISNGIISYKEDKDIKLNETITLIIKDDYSDNVPFTNYKDDIIYIIATKDLIRVGNAKTPELMPPFGFNDVESYSKDMLLKDFDTYNNSLPAKVITYFMMLITAFSYFFIRRFWLLIMYIAVLLIFNMLFVLKLKVSDYIKLAIYISTLPFVLEIFSLVAGGRYTTGADFISFLIASVYAYYALRAMRLDSMIMDVIDKAPEEKIENAIKNAQEELDKQLREIEHEVEKRQQEEREKNENKPETEDNENDKKE